jgi:glycosyltransferase involved in cell wall biosynthesis
MEPCRTSFEKLSVLMPVYNERWTLGTIIGRVLAVPLPLELVCVDDGSSDGSWEELQKLAAAEPRVRAFRHERNRGKGAAIRTAIEHMTGDVAVVQDADLEYDPNDYLSLLVPILDGRADAVFGSRFVGHPRRVLYFWHRVANGLLTLLSNMANDVDLTDMETCYKMVRADVLRELRLQSNTFTLEPEITCRLSQWGARIYEVPISYSGRTYDEGKKIKARDAVKAFWEIFRCRVLDVRFTRHNGFYALKSMSHARRYNRWLLRQCRPYIGARILEAGAGIGNFTSMFVNCERLVLLDRDPLYVKYLKSRMAGREHVRIVQADLAGTTYPWSPADVTQWREERLDTVLCMNVLEHIEDDEQVLRRFHDVLTPHGHCIVVAPAGKGLASGLDHELGHLRRYGPQELEEKMQRAGFDVVASRRVSRGAALVWWLFGRLFRCRHISPRLTGWFDRLFPVARLLDRGLPFPGISIIMVGRRRGAGPGRPDQETRFA